MFFVPLALLCIAAVGAYLYADASRMRQSIERDEEHLVNLLGSQVQDSLARVHGDVRYLAAQEILFDFLQGNRGVAETLAQEYARFAAQRKLYDQIRILDPSGMELLRVNHRDGATSIVPAEELADKSDRYYVRAARAMPTGEIYVSAFDLNVEDGEIEMPYRPVIRFVAAIDESSGRRIGFLVFNYDGRRVLDTFRRTSMSSPGDIWLLNSDGYWLSNPSRSEEWGFMFENPETHTLAARQPDVWDAINGADETRIDVNDDLVTRVKVCGVSGCGPESSSGAPRFVLPYDAPDLPWVVVSRVPAAAASGLGLVSPSIGILAVFIGVLLLVGIIAGLTAWRMSQAVESLRSKEQQLRNSEERFRILLEAAPDAIIISDAKGRIILSNERASTYFGYSREVLMTMSVEDLVPPGARVRHKAHRSEYMKHPDTRVLRPMMDMHGIRSDGSTFPVEVSLAPARTGEGTVVISVVRDHSKQRELETQFRQSQKLEAIGQLTGGMAHDFNNLLGVIIGNLELLNRHLQDNEEALKRVNTAYRSAQRGADLTRRMLAVARRQSLRPQPVCVNEIVEEILGILPRTLGPDIDLKTHLDEDLPAVMVDPSEMENALLNLAINARDAMPGGGRLYIRTEQVELNEDYTPVFNGEIKAGQYVRICISDNGSGMAPDVLQRVFEPFFTTKEHGKGSGLGLAMIYGFIKQSRGNVRIYSEPGEGTTVNIYLPSTDQSPTRKKPTVNHGENRAKNRETVLVVDDEVELLEIALTFLEELGYVVFTATDGNSALDTLSRHPEVDLLLTDVVMPGGLHGVALANAARTRCPGIKVLYTSGFPSNVLADKSEIRVDAPMISKPYRRDELARRVREVLDSA